MPQKAASRSVRKATSRRSRCDEKVYLREEGILDLVKSTLHYLKPAALQRQGVALMGEMIDIIRGESDIELDKDARFRDDAWTKNPLYRRLGQSYLAFCDSLQGLLDNPAEDWRDHERAKFMVELCMSALAPTNYLPGNPAALKKALDTRGKSLLQGTGNLLSNLKDRRILPSPVDPDHFKVGENLAVSKGAVIFRNDLLEIIQYAPTTREVHEIPVLLIAPQINKFYFLDLAPGRSLVEFLVAKGHQTFAVSWQNPGEQENRWRLDDYCLALQEAMDAVLSITAAKSLNAFGFCAGGITMTALLAHLNHTGNQHKINTVSYAVTLLNFSQPASISIFRLRQLLTIMRWNSHRQGVIKGEDLGTIFALLRPNDLIWSYWVNNYLMGNDAPRFDIMAWNSDSTNLPEGLYEDFLHIFENNALYKSGRMKILGADIDLRKITQNAFVAGAIKDHLTPWAGCYQTTQLLGGETEFVLSNSGHVAALINPPGNPKSFYMSGPKPGADSQAWLEAADRQSGSWWEHWVEWANTRSGGKKRAKSRLGNRKYPPLADAPGTYVFSKP